ncbi:MAG: glycosyltransferase family 9 protein [Rhodospirillaceae bacterium]|jgi:ADP-heptose:LPS heptosyltransferase|nr:glycosyltransferase family 9 protein [Rhodospirillaceae bacterium]MBT3931543.1 glycosyltransferase family 9 protein [Rhodospirillaceae bacterium]MBT4773688.1 glycosyltransferase family 9 protein [Rhodospirillaceae bacterium]MBT5358508.1 glycosyltransferase family 9 protein [Rhodospirillaceae bacterium]MBT5770645.1 glycosyltransferase family 9 protein [Rhodospirillaceae bacterium]
MRILYVGPNRIGDAVLSSGLLNFLNRNYPDARFTVACGASAAPLFEELPGLERLIPMQKRPRAGHWRSLWRQVAGHRWSLVVDVRRSVIPWTVLTSRRAVAPPSSHRDEHAVVAFSRTLGLSENPPIPRLWVGAKHHAAATDLLPEGRPVIAVAPTANWQGKIWPAERFVETLQRLTGIAGSQADAVLPDAAIAVLGAENERDAAAAVLDAIPADRRIDLVGTQDLPTVSACLLRSSLFVGNDSGLMHMAAAAGIPTLGLFGPSRPERYGPWGSRATWVTTEKPYSELVGGKGYDHRTTETLMDSLSVDTVVRASASLWRRVGEDRE